MNDYDVYMYVTIVTKEPRLISPHEIIRRKCSDPKQEVVDELAFLIEENREKAFCIFIDYEIWDDDGTNIPEMSQCSWSSVSGVQMSQEERQLQEQYNE